MVKKQTADHSGIYAWALLRITLGAILFWAFLDKLFGLGFATCRDADTNVVTTMCSKAWLSGGSPTGGFLEFGTKGPLAEMYKSMAGNPIIDWLFMLGLLCIGTALILGIGIRVATVTGSLLMAMLWAAALPPANNPVLDEHIIYILILVGLYQTKDRQVWGLGSWWSRQPLVKKHPVLQ